MAMQHGGPAFPLDHATTTAIHGDRFPDAAQGMSLRDYFAAKALAGAMTNATHLDELEDDVLSRAAQQCYRMADAMLEARK